MMSYEEVLGVFDAIAEDLKVRGQELRDYLEDDPDEDETPQNILMELEVMLASELREVKTMLHTKF